MVVKLKEKFEKTRQVRNNDKSKNYILRGQRNVRFRERNLSNEKKSYNLSWKNNDQLSDYYLRKNILSNTRVLMCTSTEITMLCVSVVCCRASEKWVKKGEAP